MVTDFQDIKKSIVQIQTKIKGVFHTLGTGFLISKEGHIVTCSHIFIDNTIKMYRAVFTLENDLEFSCNISIDSEMYTSSNLEDVTILKINCNLPFEITPLILKNLKCFDKLSVQTFGFPAIDDFKGIHSSGNLVGDFIIENSIERIQGRFEEVEEGFSGAPVWDSKTGEVVGMIYKIVNPNESLRNTRTTFITPAKLIKYVFEKQHLLNTSNKKTSNNYQNDLFKGSWHVFVPFCPIINFETFKDKNQLFSNYERQELRFKIEFDKNTNLYWFDFGIAVWHINISFEVTRIFNFSLLRRILYKQLLGNNHQLYDKTEQLLNIIQAEFSVNKKFLTNLGYAISLVDIQEYSIENSFLNNALKLFSSPSVLIPSDTTVNFNEKLDNEKIEELDSIELNFIKNGIPHKEYYSFDVKGISLGYASWSGVSTFIQDKGNYNKILNEFIDFEINIQSLWWYCSHFKDLALKGDTEFIKENHNQNKIKNRFASLFSVLPRESAVHRLYKEAIIETSRIKQVYNDLKEWL